MKSFEPGLPDNVVICRASMRRKMMSNSVRAEVGLWDTRLSPRLVSFATRKGPVSDPIMRDNRRIPDCERLNDCIYRRWEGAVEPRPPHGFQPRGCVLLSHLRASNLF